MKFALVFLLVVATTVYGCERNTNCMFDAGVYSFLRVTFVNDMYSCMTEVPSNSTFDEFLTRLNVTIQGLKAEFNGIREGCTREDDPCEDSNEPLCSLADRIQEIPPTFQEAEAHIAWRDAQADEQGVTRPSVCAAPHFKRVYNKIRIWDDCNY